MGSSSSAPTPPSYTALSGAASDAQNTFLQTMKEQLSWAKDQFGLNKAYTDTVKDKLSGVMDTSLENAKKDRARYEQVYQPLQDKFIQRAVDYTSPSRMQANRSAAVANVATQYDQAGDEARRKLEGFGIDPSSTRYAALDKGVRMAKAAAAAGAANLSDRQTEAYGDQMLSGAIGMGQVLPGQSINETATGANAGTSGVGAQNQTYSASAGSLGNPTAWGGLQLGALGQWNNALTQGYGAQLAQYNANQGQSSGLGSALGLVGGIAGTAAGAYFGGPMGAMAGGSAGSALGKGIGGAIDSKANGGMVEGVPTGAPRSPMTSGGKIPMSASPSGGATTDDIPGQVRGGGAINVDAGEFILPRRTTQFYGTKFLRGLIEKADKHMGHAPPSPAMGGARGALPAQGHMMHRPRPPAGALPGVTHVPRS